MLSFAKHAVITTVTVVVVLWLGLQVPYVKDLIRKALT